MKHYPISVRQVLLFTCKEELFRRSLAIFIKALLFFSKPSQVLLSTKLKNPKLPSQPSPPFLLFLKSCFKHLRTTYKYRKHVPWEK